MPWLRSKAHGFCVLDPSEPKSIGHVQFVNQRKEKKRGKKDATRKYSNSDTPECERGPSTSERSVSSELKLVSMP